MGDDAFFVGSSGISTGSISGTAPRSGVFGYRLGDTSIGERLLPAALTEFYARVGAFSAGSWGTTPRLIEWRNGATALGAVRVINDGSGLRVLSVEVAGSPVATGSTVLAGDTHYLVEVYVRLGASGEITLRLEGATEATFTGDTDPGTASTVDRVRYYQNGFLVPAVYLDDLALNDTSGAADNSWCGDGHVIRLAPAGNGDRSELTGSDGDSIDNFLLVGETPHDGDTTHVQSDQVGAADLYALADITLDPDEAIKRVWVEARARETAAEGHTIQVGIKSTNEWWGGDETLTTSYRAVRGAEYLTNPDTGNAWTESEVGALQAGVKAT